MVSILLININRVFAQTVQPIPKQTSSGWTTNNPFHTDVFVENKGQFNDWAKSTLPILYAVNNADKIFFTKQGVIFRVQKQDSLSEEERENQEHNTKEKDQEEEEKMFFVSMNWEGCNPNVELIVSDVSEGYYTFAEKGYENVKAKGYKKLLYKDLYHNIDVEYTIPAKGGIKYKIVLHPGANPSLLKMNYSGDVEELKTNYEGNTIIESLAGAIIDHAPLSYYEESKQALKSSFKISNNTVSFKLHTSSPSQQTIIIDPWTTTSTSLDTNNIALDIDYDIYGNVFVSGGSYPFKLSKYSNTGAHLWTFTNPSNWGFPQEYSKFCVLPNSGTTFIAEGSLFTGTSNRIMKIDYNGVLNYTSQGFGQNNEIWHMFYNNCSRQLIGFGGGTNSTHNIKLIADTNLSSGTSKCFNGLSCSRNDIASSIMDNNGDFYALMTSNVCTTVEGHLQKSLYSTSYSPPLAFDVQSYCTFNELQSLHGISGSIKTVRANALALNNNYVFTYDGKTLKVWDKTIGSLLDSIIVDNTYATGNLRVHEGIDVDGCNTIYVGGSSKVHVYTFTGNSFTTLSPITANITGNVHDVKLNRSSGKLYVCGNGFVTEAIPPIACFISQIQTILTVTTDSCVGSACVKATGGIPPYHYQWSNGSTDSCITNLFTGVYTVTLTDNSCAYTYHIDTVTINSLINLAIAPFNPVICKGDSITLVALSTNTDIAYHWNTGSNENAIRVAPSANTSYNITVNNSTCSANTSVVVNVNPIKQTTINPVICQGTSFHVGTHYYNSTGIYVDTLSTSLGCDSIITTKLIVNPTKQTTLNPVICQGKIFHVGIHSYSATGIYKDTLTTYLGCDSIVTTNLTVNSSINIAQYSPICQGEIYPVGTHVYTTAGTYLDSLTSIITGCDSIVTTILSIYPVYHINVNKTICQGKIYHVGIHNYTTSGTYIDTLTTYYLSCDSIITSNLTVNPVKDIIINPVICQGEIVTIGTHTYNIAGTYIDTLSTSLGCDSIITTNLTVNPTKQTTLNPVICQGEAVTIGTHSYTIAGVYNDTLSTSLGCDSIITINLTVNPTKQTTLNPVICQGEIFNVGVHFYNTSGTYIDSLTTFLGCDSIITTNLTVKPIYNITDNKTICEGEVVSVGTNNYNNTGTYIDTLSTSLGCDSIITTYLTVNPVKVSTINPIICQGEFYQIGVHAYNTAGTYKDTLSTSLGCDSIVTTNLIIIPQYNIILNRFICQGQMYQVGIHNYTTTGIYKDTLTTLNSGCDSIITTNLFVNPIKHTTVNPVICQGEAYYMDSHPYTLAGTYVDTLITSIGCDSIVTINLLVVPFPIINLGNDSTLCYGQSLSLDATYQYATYLWQDNSTNPTYNVNHEGTYYVKLSIDSNCFANDTINIYYKYCDTSIYIPNSFTPNGDGLNDVFTIKTNYNFINFKLVIYDRWGELLFESDDINKGWDGTYKGKVAPLNVYIYQFTGTIKETGENIKKTGRVTVVR